MDAFLFVCFQVVYIILYIKVLRSNIMVQGKNLVGAVGAFGRNLTDCFAFVIAVPRLLLVAFLRSSGLGTEKQVLAVDEIIVSCRIQVGGETCFQNGK